MTIDNSQSIDKYRNAIKRAIEIKTYINVEGIGKLP